MNSPCLFLVLYFCLQISAIQATDYNPLMPVLPGEVQATNTEFKDNKREDRTIPLRIYFVQSDKPLPVILHSHGLGGTRNTSEFLGKHWASRGYVCVFTQHPGSDDSVWRDTPMRDRMTNMNQAASGQNLKLRVDDITATLNQLETWQKQSGHFLYGKIDLEHVGMSGHSFGAVTTQAVSGQSYPVIGQKWTDKRIDAAIPLSPSGSRNATDTANLFSKVAIPWLLMTGTRDTSPIGNLSAESRLNVFPNLPKSIDRYELVLENAQHSVFTERALPNEDKQDKTRHHQSIKAISTAFWDSYLKEDNTAKDWLQGTGAKESLEQKDSWKIAKQE